MQSALPVLLLTAVSFLSTSLGSRNTARGDDARGLTTGGPSQDAKSVQQQGPIRGSGKVVTITKQLDAVRAIQISAGDQLEIIQGSRSTLTIEAEDNIQPLLETTVDNGRLRLNWKTPEGTTSSTRVMVVNGKTIIFPYGVRTFPSPMDK